MTQQNKNQPQESVPDDAPLDDMHVEELKRDMRSAKMADWLQKNQQKLFAAVVIILLAMAAAGLWSEKQKTYKESAAMMYFQALSVVDDAQRKALLEAVVSGYGDTAYGVLSHLRLAPLADTEAHLRAVVDNDDATAELRWQAALDLAEFFIDQGKADEAKTLLNLAVGKQFEQLRYYLLSEVSTDAEKKAYLQKALDAISNDAVLKDKIEAQIAQMGI